MASNGSIGRVILTIKSSRYEKSKQTTDQKKKNPRAATSGDRLKRTTTTRKLQEKGSNLQEVVRPFHKVEGLYPKPSPPRPEGAFANSAILQYVMNIWQLTCRLMIIKVDKASVFCKCYNEIFLFF